MTMDEAAAQARERVTRWIEESRGVFGLLPELLENDQRLVVKLEQSERESEKLRKEAGEVRNEAAGLRKEVADLRQENTDLRRELGEVRKGQGDVAREMDDLRKENEKLRGEKDEAAQAFARLLETVQSTNVIAQKLGVTKSPFARAKEGAHSPPGAPTPHE
jgi:septal ring factor EnvC (AmiA/AmiB activator)